MFRRDVQGLCEASLIEIEYDMKTVSEKVVFNERELLAIETMLYKSDDTSSDEILDAGSVASTAMETTVSLTSNPLIELQMFEKKNWGFISNVDLVRCNIES